MNIYKYINSADIAKHLKETGYECSALESAYIVEMCRSITTEEKNRVRMEIIHTTENVTIGNDNLHNFLANQAISEASGKNTYHDTEVFFSDIELNIPTPFKKGDILIPLTEDIELVAINNMDAFVLASDEGEFSAYGEFGLVGLDRKYLLDCQYYPKGTALFHDSKRRERRLQLISDYVKGNITETQMREAYRMAALEITEAELNDFFSDMKSVN